MTIDWRPLPDPPALGEPYVTPYDGEEVLIYADSATVDIVRLAWWSDGVEQYPGSLTWERGWWSYRHSVTQEELDFLTPSHWAPFELPADKTPAGANRLQDLENAIEWAVEDLTSQEKATLSGDVITSEGYELLPKLLAAGTLIQSDRHGEYVLWELTGLGHQVRAAALAARKPPLVI